MSHNIIKINSQKSNSLGNIQLNTKNITKSENFDNGKILGSNGINWFDIEAPWINEYQKTLYTSYTGTTFTNTYQWEIPYIYNPSGYEYFIAIGPNIINSVTYLTFHTSADVTALKTSGNSQWYYGFQFNNKGTYRLSATIELGPFSSNISSLTLQWSNNNNTKKYGPKVNIHKPSEKFCKILGVVDANPNDIVGLYMNEKNNNPYATGSFFNTTVNIEKIN